MSSLLILTEAGEGIGLGHYTRCSAIREYTVSKGIHCEMLIYIKGDYHFAFEGEKKNWIENFEWISGKKNLKNVLVDSYLAPTELYKKLKSYFDKLIVLDDYNRIVYDADLLINPNVFFNAKKYIQQRGEKLGGKDFVILRKIFQNVSVPSIDEHINKILITVGGSDYRNIIPTLINVFRERNEEIRIISPNKELDIQNLSHVKIMGKQNEHQIYQQFQWADVVISACGQTLHELASMGKPTIGICIDKDQKPNQAYYLKQGFLSTEINWNDGDIENKILDNLALLKSKDKRENITKKSLTLVNRNGVENIVNAIQEL